MRVRSEISRAFNKRKVSKVSRKVNNFFCRFSISSLNRKMSTKCQDQEDNPFSVDEIEPRLYLGNCTAARNIKFLISQRISHILTVDSFPIPNYVCSSASVVNKYVHIADMARENILEYFEECISFIEEALKDPEATNGVLVHCFYGVSRSSTIVIAYLMKKYEISYRKAFEK